MIDMNVQEPLRQQRAFSFFFKVLTAVQAQAAGIDGIYTVHVPVNIADQKLRINKEDLSC